ncbi:MAG: DUF5715 family protein, partial [bacterium]|nr:DUF5715 family protein [bacterium]
MTKHIIAVILILWIGDAAEAQSLKGSPTSLDRQEQKAKEYGYAIFASAMMVREAIDKDLYPVYSNGDFRFHKVDHPVARPEVKLFIGRLSRQYKKVCGDKLVVTGLTRPKDEPLPNSSDRSVHPAGMAVDVRIPPKRSCRRWLEDVVMHIESSGAIEATRENWPPHYHIAVFPEYISYAIRVAAGQPATTGPVVASAEDMYRVKKGDSLWKIARRHDTTVAHLRELNKL